MSIQAEKLLARAFAPVEQSYDARDSMLYALSLGLGADPLDRQQLAYVFEGVAGGLQALPTMVNVLGYSGFWADQPDTGIDWKKLVHAEQAFVLHRPLAASGRVIGRNRVSALYDKGADKGALMVQTREVTDAVTGAAVATVTQTTLLRGDGGYSADGNDGESGAPATLPPPHPMPSRSPDSICDLPTLAQAALLYRLSGDYNPLHADPAVAQAAGFSRPILQGLCTMGVALHAVLKNRLGYDASSVHGMRVRFTAPVLPGETLRTEMWLDGMVVSFRTTALERGVVVLNAGRVDLSHAPQINFN
jgi:acyl dehydratase